MGGRKTSSTNTADQRPLLSTLLDASIQERSTTPCPVPLWALPLHLLLTEAS